jgi:hypothetical protein
MQIAASRTRPSPWGGAMPNADAPLVTPKPPDQLYADLEAQLVMAVADFGLDELTQMLDAAEAIRRARRL